MQQFISVSLFAHLSKVDGVENRLDVFLGLELVNNGTTWYNAGLKVFILNTKFVVLYSWGGFSGA